MLTASLSHTCALIVPSKSKTQRELGVRALWLNRHLPSCRAIFKLNV